MSSAGAVNHVLGRLKRISDPKTVYLTLPDTRHGRAQSPLLIYHMPGVSREGSMQRRSGEKDTICSACVFSPIGENLDTVPTEAITQQRGRSRVLVSSVMASSKTLIPVTSIRLNSDYLTAMQQI